MQPSSPYQPQTPQQSSGIPSQQPTYGASNPAYPPTPQAPAPQQHDYSFIMNPEKPRRQRSFTLPGSSGPLRILFIVGGLLLVFIILVILKNLLFGSGNNLQSFVTIAQDQQELIHLSTNASQQQGLSITNQNFAMTAQLSLTSAQTDLIAYMQDNGKKVNLKTLSLKINASIDTQLTTAASIGTYDKSFQEVMQSKLTTYQQDLKQTYAQTKGSKGRALLNKDYQGAQLLLQQLNTPAS